MPWKPFSTKKLQKLYATWEKRLEVEGLGVVGRQPNPYQSGTVGHDSITRSAKTAYYRAMTAAAKNHKRYDSAVDRVVMTMIADGASLVRVTQELQRLKMVPKNRCAVRFIIRKYEERWGIRVRK